MKYLSIVLLISVIYSQDIQRTSEFKRSTFRGQDCDDTEYRDYKGSPAWKGYGRWLSECDSISTTFYDKEFALRDKQRQKEQATKDSLEQIEIDNMDLDTELDMDVMWDNTVWNEITDIGEEYIGEVEQITAVAGVRGAEAEDEALNHLYYRRSMKGLALIDLQKAYGKLKIKRDNLIKTNPKHPKLEKINNLLSQLQIKIKKV
mgnify:CR=1 FL=1